MRTAQYPNLGHDVRQRRGVRPENDAEAVKWYRLAADQGALHSRQYSLGVMYDPIGEGVPENDTEAVKWYRLAADQGPCRRPI